MGLGYNPGMKPKKQPKPDFVQNAARIVKESIADHEMPLSGNLEEAWQEWSRSIQKVDERGMTLLRAAFFAGAEASKPKR